MNTPYIKIKTLIADDHEMVREGLQIMIKKIDEIEIIGEASNGEELIVLTRKLGPDVILMDIKMPKCNGVEATKIIKKEFPHIGIIALSSFDEESLIMDMLNAGAKGYLLKNASKQEIMAAIKAAYKDEAYYCMDVNLKLAQIVARGGHYIDPKKQRPFFSARELQVIEMICDGLPSKQIANVLNLKTRTIERYRDTIMNKMNVNNAAGVVLYAVTNGLYSKNKKS